MARKLNRKAAEAYSRNFSATVMDEFYANRQAASGQDILEITPLQQINLLLIQRLYVRWQEDTLRLRSPYFNYEHPQVKEALQHFMNTLSRHILVERAALQPLLEEAVLDSLRLLLQPMAYFDELLRRYPQRENLLASLRYLRWQESITGMLQEQLEQGEITDPDFLLTLLDASIKSGKVTLDAIDEQIMAYEQVLPLPLELVDEPAKDIPAPLKEEEEGDFFSAITRSAPRPSRPAPRVEPPTEPQPEPKAEPQPQAQAPRPAPEPKKEAAPIPASARVTTVVSPIADPDPTPRPQPRPATPPLLRPHLERSGLERSGLERSGLPAPQYTLHPKNRKKKAAPLIPALTGEKKSRSTKNLSRKKAVPPWYKSPAAPAFATTSPLISALCL
ncbi:hypothetical protein [Cesiribacter andamanensis]|uniref:Uncharacterized protein n=1 Tax=Cesiribacter andamanensis AMV16 TaxID=1279009 RepID=M7N8T3_9BACT|nr:hypothetical protein [Cesiribacter andamanensis]EMR03621.1 hypothetical protein ADICEAN_01218 [Cesiribacter andamanensis AMV16]